MALGWLGWESLLLQVRTSSLAVHQSAEMSFAGLRLHSTPLLCNLERVSVSCSPVQQPCGTGWLGRVCV